ncbi:MAG: hypothetical protein HWN66_14805, partial [Candidatus Helarchaeota archaeon]|nr:hypothetical protein [Candidatus Helarchaeota archaeon]
MLIYLKHRYNILGKIPFDSKDKRFQFSVPLENKPAVIVYLIPGENSVETFHESEVSKELLGFLQSNKYDFGNLREKLKSELSELSSGSYKAARKLLHLIKYCFYCANLNENLLSFKEAFWSIDKSEWKTKPYLPAIADWYLQAHPDIPLDENTYKAIQYYIDHDFEPFLALRYLHRAKKESNPYDRWIDATTAAEWAIKEFLIRLKPDVKAVLLEVPSPPLYKLYGSVLESYTNE